MAINQKLNPALNLMIRDAAPAAFRQQSYPAAFSRTLEAILQEKKMYPKDLAALLNVDRRTIYKVLQDDEFQASKQMVVAISVVLKLSPHDAFALVDKAGIRLRMTSAQDAAYFSIISSCGAYSLEDINEVLIDKGITPLGCRQKSF